MLIDTRAIGFRLTDAIWRYVEARIETALGPFARAISVVTVRLDDINATRGGIDKRCSVVVNLRGRNVEVATAVHEDLYAAIDEAAARIRRQVERAAKRGLIRQRRDPQRPGALVTV